ncbi:unnamed protein product, partial [Menidia menidia]
ETLACVKNSFLWYNRKNDVTLLSHTCTSCAAKAHPKNIFKAAMASITVGIPMERVAFDLMGPLNDTERHNHYILIELKTCFITSPECHLAEDFCRYGRNVSQGLGCDDPVCRCGLLSNRM